MAVTETRAAVRARIQRSEVSGLLRGGRPDLQQEAMSRRVTTTEDVRVSGERGLDEPVVLTIHERRLDQDGFRDETRLELATCCSCRGVLREETIAASCELCHRVLCEQYAAARTCTVCGSSACARHSVTVGGKTFCRRHILGALFAWLTPST